MATIAHLTPLATNPLLASGKALDNRFPFGSSSKFEPVNSSARRVSIFSLREGISVALASKRPPSISFNSACVIVGCEFPCAVVFVFGFSHAARRVSNSCATAM